MVHCSYLFESKPQICRPRSILKSCFEGHTPTCWTLRGVRISSPRRDMDLWVKASVSCAGSNPSNSADLPKAGEEGQGKRGHTGHGTPNGCKANSTERHSKAENIPKSLRQDLQDTHSSGRLFTPLISLRFTAKNLVLGPSMVQRPRGGFPKTPKRFARS